MLDVLLLEPPSNMQKIQKLRARIPRFSASLPFVCIAPYLLKEGFNVDFLDMRISSLSELKEILQRDKPLIAGITIMPGSQMRLAIKINQIIKFCSPDTKIVWGGSFPSLHYEFCLGIPGVDIVVCGEGEITLTEIASALRNGNERELHNIKGIAFKKDNHVVATEARTPVDLDEYPVGAWHILDKYIQNYIGEERFLTINTARGCPYNCSFCYNNLLYKGFKRYRFKSINTVFQEVDYLIEKYDLKKIEFLDDDFLGNKKRGIEILLTLHKKYPKLKFHLKARISELKDENMVRFFSETGCETMFVGAESGSSEQLEQIKKGCSTNDMLEVAKLCAKYDIRVVYSFTCGYPDETAKDLASTVLIAEMLKNIGPRNNCIMEIISPIQGTPLFNDLEEKKLLPKKNISNWCYMTDWKSAKHKPWLSLSAGFYETFQLMFFLAYASSDLYGSENVRASTSVLSKWAKYRLSNMKRQRMFFEFRFANFLLKKALWNL